jgi:hypothetical protein
MFINKQKMKTDYLEEMEQLNMEKVKMDDSRLISLIRNYWIENPSNEHYNLTSAKSLDPSVGQAAIVDNKLKFNRFHFLFIDKHYRFLDWQILTLFVHVPTMYFTPVFFT